LYEIEIPAGLESVWTKVIADSGKALEILRQGHLWKEEMPELESVLAEMENQEAKDYLASGFEWAKEVASHYPVGMTRVLDYLHWKYKVVILDEFDLDNNIWG